jgi:hypothetical protein
MQYRCLSFSLIASGARVETLRTPELSGIQTYGVHGIAANISAAYISHILVSSLGDLAVTPRVSSAGECDYVAN